MGEAESLAADAATPETVAETQAAGTGTGAQGDEADLGELRQFVTFFMGKECFALPMDRVLEIIRVPQVVQVPLTPSGFEGLANLRGAILPIMDLRRTVGLEPRPVDDASRTIVVDCGRPVGLIVDRVSQVVGFALDRIETPEANATFAAGGIEGLLDGVVKDADGVGLIQILDASRAVLSASVPVTGAGPGGATTVRAGAQTEDESGDDALTQFVNLVVDGQEYAFDITEVDEIVRPPDTIFEVPQTASHVLGMIDLRGRLLPIVSLRGLFGLPDLPVSETNRILVLHVAATGEPEARVGLVVDNVREVLTVSRKDQVAVSALISRGGIDRIGTMCRLEGGKRLVGVLSGHTLFQDGAIRAAMAEAAASEIRDEESDAMAEDSDRTGATGGETGDETQLVVYQLADQEYGVEIGAVREIIRVPSELRKVPGAPAWVAGIITLRGAVLPVVTMRTRFGLPDAGRCDRQRIMVLARAGTVTGFIVDSVSEVLRLSRGLIEPAPDLSAEQRTLIGNVANLDGGRRIIQILDATALLASHGADGLDATDMAMSA
ncbi:chemotaxis protein CheW [Rhodovulum strictum]